MKKLMTMALMAASCLLSATGRSEGFPLEWAFLEGTARVRLIERLTECGRTNEVTLLEACADNDAAKAECALRRLVDQTGDRRLGAGLVRMLIASGRTAEAQELERKLQTHRAPPRKLTTVGALEAPDFSGKTPVVFLHGYNGDADTWSDFTREFLSETGGYGKDDVLVFQYYDDDDKSFGSFDGKLTTFGYDTNTKITNIASRVETATTVWLRRRHGLSDDDASHDAELPAVDWICHSMGGLVFRHVLRDRPKLVRRCVTLGTPHFGQGIGGNVIVGYLVGEQAREMSFGSTALWNLATDWHFLGKRTEDILFVAGIAKREKDSGICHDGLICTFSATLQTAEDAQFAQNTYFVNRIHSTALSLAYEGILALPQMPQEKGTKDPIFKLVYGYLNDCGYFADGKRPTQEQVLTDDGCADADGLLTNVVSRGALFVQVMDGATNTAERLEKPVKYDPGTFVPDKVVDSLTFNNVVYEEESDGLTRENGSDDEGCEKGLVMLFGNIPTGDCEAQIGRSAGTSRPKYKDTFHLAGGGTTLVRTRPGAARPLCAVSVKDINGVSKSVVVSNDWLAASGLVNNAENLSACVTVSSAPGANGYPVAVSHLLGLDPADADSTLRITSLTVGDDLSFTVAAGNRPLEAGTAPVALQAKETLGDKTWQTVEVPAGSWKLTPSVGHFFRAALRW